MRNIYCGLTVCELMKIPIDIILGDRVERGGRLIEDYYRRVAVNGACYRDLLTLAARELYTVGVELLIDIGINAAGQSFYPLGEPAFYDGIVELFGIGLGIHRDIFPPP